MSLQCADGAVSVQVGDVRSIANQVVNTTVTDDAGRVGSGLLEAFVLGEVCVEDVDIGTFAQLLGYLLLRRIFVADKTDE